MFKTAVPAGSDSGAALVAQFSENDKQNQALDDTAVINTGVAEGTVVKWSTSLSKWVLCDGTVALESTDTIGVVTYANGTSGQVKTSGVYVDADLSTVGKYYCQSDGTIGQTATKVFIGTVSSPGRLCLPGGGGGVQPATTDELGGIMVGSGLMVTPEGILSTNSTIQSISITAGTIAHGGTIPLPSGYTRDQCKYAVWANTATYGRDSTTKINCSVNQSTGVVAFQYYNGVSEVWFNGTTAGYLCIGVK